ncbi:MAG: DUF4364 family protein [Oscillospiraceae bacterium]|nr:DUF4364 family protein [Oscillospiraceae bacterium]
MSRAFGFIHDGLEIKVLILYIMRRLPRPISLEDLTMLVMCDDGISYFLYTDCLHDLVRTEHLEFRDEKYFITPKGERNGKISENTLPKSIKKIVDATTLLHENALNRADMIRTVHKKNTDDGCTVTLSLSDGLGEIVSIDLYAANDEQAQAMENGFQKNAEIIYNELIRNILS